MNFFDGWKALNKRFDEGDLTAHAQLVGYKLFAIFNEQMFPESLPLTDRELQSLTNIKSGQTIVEARRQLKNAGLIDFKKAKNKPTRYRLTIKHESSTNQAPIKHEPSKNENPNIRAREDVKTEDVKTKNNNNSAGACENLDEVLDYWEEFCGGRLTFEHQSQLKAWVNQKGVEWVKEVMQTAADSNNNPRGISFNYLKAIVQNKLNAQAQKPAKTSVADMLKALDEQIKW